MTMDLLQHQFWEYTSVTYLSMPQHTIQYKILEGENFGEFSELQEIHQNFLVQNFPSLYS